MIATESAYAKVNLFLEVTRRRDDGYHEIRSVMQTVSLCDTLELAESGDGRIFVSCDVSYIPCDERNLAYRAAKSFFSLVPDLFRGISIHIEKRIPCAAGLGGGSADAAAVLRALNRMYGYPVCEDALLREAAKLGADVPFCVRGGTYLATGIGEKLDAVRNIPDCFFVITGGRESVCTKDAYEKLDLIGFRPDDVAFEGILGAIDAGDLRGICENVRNSFDPLVASAEEIKSVLVGSGALGAMVSGSGGSVFGVFDSKDAAEHAADELRCRGLDAFVCVNIK